MAARKTFLLRLSPALHEKLQAWAEQEMRSLNAQIEYLLREAVARRGGFRVDDDAKDESPEEQDGG